jgi:WD40 repeat protein
VLTIIQAGISCKWIHDSQCFLLEHLDTINDSPSHIYHSALPSTPHSTWLQECYGSELLQEVKVINRVPAGWGICSRTVSLGTNVFGVSCWNNIVAVASGHRDIIILDVVTGSQTATLSGHTDEVNTVTFSSDGRSLVSGSDDKTVKLWDVQTGGTIQTFSGHNKLVHCVSISMDSAKIASGSFDDTIRVWNVQTGECCCVIESEGETRCIKFSPTNSQHFLSVTNSKVSQWNISGHQAGPKFDGCYADFSPDGTQLVSQQVKSVTVQNPSSGVVVAEFQTIEANTMCCCFSPDGQIVVVSVGSTICVWNIAGIEPHLIETFTGHTGVVSSFAFSSPSSLISGSVDGSVKFWKIATQSVDLVGTKPKSISLTPAKIMSIALQAKDNIFITSDSDGMVKTWDIFTGLCKASFQTPAKGVHERDIQLINSGLVLAWHTNQKIRIWDVEKEKLLLTTDGPYGLEDIKISEDGSRVFSIGATVIQAQSIQTGGIVGKARIKFIDRNKASLTTYGSRVWVCYPNAESQVWDFENPDSPPVQLPDVSLHILHPGGTMVWDTGSSCVKEKATGKVVFWLSKRYGKFVNVKWNNQNLLVSFMSGEVLVLDFSHVLPL